jgi:tetratricopeptide (TPR) repeat protein/TolB-like protein/DNA-binding winged helix-turn-helix (wHTH) protein
VKSDLLQGFYLGDLLVDPRKGQVAGRAGSAHLPPKAMEVLLCLASDPGELVTRDALIETVWGDGHGSQEALNHAMSQIRHALHDNHDRPEFVQTLPKRGYRLLADVTPISAHTSSIVLGTPGGGAAQHSGLFENLKQRGVLETAFAYLILGWLLIQVADIVFGQLHLPAWTATFVTVLVIAGFPIAVLLSWFLEFRDGRAVPHELSGADSLKRRFSRTYLSVVGALAIAAVFVFAYDNFVGLPQPEITEAPAIALESELPPVQDNSIAVLPFFNLDGSDVTQVFANGLADDVITRLSRVPGLLVSSRGDAFTLDPNSSSQKVRERLRVALYLEGSVQIAGDVLRVIVQLIDSESGFHVFSRSFDRPLEGFFDMRDEITELTVANVRVALPPETQAASKVSADDPSLDAYILFRRGDDASHRPITIESIESAIAWFDAALAIDPDYSAAHAGKCSVLVNGYPLTHDPAFIDNAEASCADALELYPNLDLVHSALGDLYRATGKYGEAESAYLEALNIDPNSVASLTGLGTIYMLQQKPDEAETRFRQAIGLHPGDWSAYNELGRFLYRSGRYVAAAEQYEYVVALDDTNTIGYTNLGITNMLVGNFEVAASVLQKAIDIEPRANTYSNLGLMHYYLGRLDEAIESHRQAVELSPNDHLKWSNLGDAVWIAGNLDEARRVFSTAEELAAKARQINPNDANSLMDLAWISAMLDKNEDARTYIDKARSQAPSDPYVHYIEGLILLRFGDANAALSALEIAAEKGYSLQMMGAEPHLAALRDHPRFKAILEHVE